MKKRKIINYLISIIAVSATTTMLAVACTKKEDSKKEDVNKNNSPEIIQPNEEKQKENNDKKENVDNESSTRVYREVELPNLVEPEHRFKSVRMTLKEIDVLSTSSDDVESIKNYKDFKKEVLFNVFVKVNNKEKTNEKIVINAVSLLSFDKESNKLKIVGNLTLPQQISVGGQYYSILEYNINSALVDSKVFNFDNSIKIVNDNIFVNLNDVYNVNNKIYLEFDSDIKNHLFNIEANENGDKQKSIDNKKLQWEVVKRVGSSLTNILEISLLNSEDIDANFLEIFKIMLKKDDFYHLYLVDHKIQSDLTKLRFKIKDENKVRTYKEVKIPQSGNENTRLKSIRQTLKEINFSLNVVDHEEFKQYSKTKVDAKVIFDVTLDDEQKTTKEIIENNNLLLTFDQRTKFLDIYSNILLPQKGLKDNKEYNVYKYAIKAFEINGKLIKLDSPIIGYPSLGMVNIYDAFAKDKKVYLEFDGDIKNHQFYISANYNGNSETPVNDEDLSWKVVRRAGVNNPTSILEVSLKNQASSNSNNYIELSKIMLKKDGYYHLYLVHDKIGSDLSKLRIMLKDNIKLVKLPDLKEENKRLRSAKQVVFDFTDVAQKGEFNEALSQPTRKKVSLIYGFGENNETAQTGEYSIDVFLALNNDQIVLKGFIPVPSVYNIGDQQKIVEQYFIKGFKYQDKTYLFTNPKIYNAKLKNEATPTILDSYIQNGNMYFEFDKNIKNMMFTVDFAKGTNLFSRTDDEDLSLKVLTKEGSTVENTILEVAPTNKLKNSDTQSLVLLMANIKNGDDVYIYNFFAKALGNPIEYRTLKLKDNNPRSPYFLDKFFCSHSNL